MSLSNGLSLQTFTDLQPRQQGAVSEEPVLGNLEQTLCYQAQLPLKIVKVT